VLSSGGHMMVAHTSYFLLYMFRRISHPLEVSPSMMGKKCPILQAKQNWKWNMYTIGKEVRHTNTPAAFERVWICTGGRGTGVSYRYQWSTL